MRGGGGGGNDDGNVGCYGDDRNISPRTIKEDASEVRSDEQNRRKFSRARDKAWKKIYLRNT